MSEVSSQQHLDKPKQGDVRGEKHGEEDVKLKKKKIKWEVRQRRAAADVCWTVNVRDIMGCKGIVDQSGERSLDSWHVK